MRKLTPKRLISLLLALLMLTGTGSTVVFADSEATDSAQTSNGRLDFEKLESIFNTRSYEDYLNRYKDKEAATSEIIVDISKFEVADNATATLSDTSKYHNVYVTPQFKIKENNEEWINSEVQKVLSNLDYDSYEVIYDYPEETKENRKYFYIRYTKANEKVEPVVEINDVGTVTFTFNVEKSGMYEIDLEYFAVVAKSANIERRLLINGKVAYSEARSISMTKSWSNLYYAQYDAEGNAIIENGKYKVSYRQDIQGNDIRAESVQTPVWTSYKVSDSSGYYNSLSFYLEEGENTISFEAEREPVAIKSLKLVPPSVEISYAEYLESIKGREESNQNAAPIYISAELFDNMSDESIYAFSNRSSSSTLPQSSTSQVINVLGGGTNYKTAGQWVSYTFTPEYSGYYNIMARFNQSALAGMFTSRTIIINGEVLFSEARNTRFNYSTDWQLETLGDGTNDFVFYFEAGKEYEVTLEVSLGDMADTIRQVEESLNEINDCYLEILKLTGAEPDEYRDYGFTRLMPEVLVSFVKEYRRLDTISKNLTELCDAKGSHVATLDKVAFLLNRMGTNESEVARNLATLKSYIGTLGTWLNDSRSQPIMLDYLLIVPADTTAKQLKGDGYEYKANSNFFESAWFEIKLFVQSFFTDYSSMGATLETDAEAVEVWISEGRDQALIIRNLVDSNFTPQSDISVNVKLVAAGTLLPSVLSGLGPDAFIGIGSVDTINYAIRSAVLPLNDFEGFDELSEEFTRAALIPLTLDGKTYGIPEKMTFSMMFYRTDILVDLGIDVPQTWDDVLKALPDLQANNMQIGLQRDYDLFLYQMTDAIEGTIVDQEGVQGRWADNGMRCGLDSNIALEAFEYYCEFYTMYSFPVSYDASNRFRTGEMPIVIGTYTALYNTLTCFATEIQGLWDFTVLPGVQKKDADGNLVFDAAGNPVISNQAVCGVVGLVMLSSCPEKQRDNTWEFIKWFCGADAQAKYSNNLITTIGNAAKHPTANIKALAEMPWSSSEYAEIVAQFDKMAAIENYPGSYIFDRYINFAFYDAYNSDADPVEALRSYITVINKEITRKRAEFGMPTLALGETLGDSATDTGAAE